MLQQQYSTWQGSEKKETTGECTTARACRSVEAMSASNSYDSFGNPTNTSFPSRYQFTGREFDNFTGLQSSRARFYDPNLGRFVSEDPIGFGGGDVNLFGYVRNKPLIFRDSRGLYPGEEVLNDPNIYRGIAAAAAAISPYIPPLGVAVAGGAAIYGAYQFGEYIARHPSNPLSHPWGYPDIPVPITAKPGPACQPLPKAIPWYSQPPIKYPIPVGPYPPQTPEKQEECYQKCQHLLGIGDYGVQFNSCYRRCTGRID